MRTLVLDFETYYDTEYSLSKMTTQDYITDPRFEVLMASYILDNGRCVVLDGHEVAPFLSALDPANTVVVNHNAAFDATILSVRYGFNPKMIVDTMSMARAVGAHIAAGGASLDALATCLRNQGFDLPAKGTAVQNAKGKRRKDFTDDEWAAYREYCKIDTVITHKLLKYLAPYLQDNPTELSFQDVILKCMARPLLAIDKDLVQEELAYVKTRREKLLQLLADTLNIPLTGLSTELRSNDRMARLYEQYGGYTEHPHGVKAGSEKDLEYVVEESGLPGAFPIPQKVSKTTGQWTWAFGKTDAPMLALLEHENPSVVGLTEVRLGTKSSIDETRCDRFMKLADAGFMCMPYLICGAHTGRMSGRDKVNVQNLPAGRAEGQTNNLRRSIIPRYNGQVCVVCDSSQVEVRCSAYMANNTPDLEAFAAKQDIYTVMASNLYGEPYDVIRKGVKVDHNPKYMKQRQVAKAAVLSCQFGTGAKAFQAYAKVVGGVALTSLEAKAIVDGYRETNWRVVDAWKTVGWAMDEMIAGRSGYFGGPNNDLFYFDGSRHVFGAHVPGIRLPSGLWINYKGLGTERGQWPDGSPKTEYFFYHGSGKRVEKKYTYNSKVYENCIAEGTDVLTNTGWKPIESITEKDFIFDGFEFVRHQGIISKDKQSCISVDGVFMTPDHKVLTKSGWVVANEITSQRERLDRGTLWHDGCAGPSWQCEGSTYMESVMRLWEYQTDAHCGHKKSSITKLRVSKRTGYKRSQKETRNVAYTNLRGLAFNETSLFKSQISDISELWRPWDNCMRRLENIRQLLQRYGRYLSGRFVFGQDRQQQGIFQRQLSMGNVFAKREQHKEIHSYSSWRRIIDCRRIWKTVQLKINNHPLSIENGGEDARTGGTSRLIKHVFDIRNCGPRSRFVVRGEQGPVIVHNCVQGLAFQVMAHQAVRIAARYPIVMNVHDEWVCVVPESEAQECLDYMIDCMRTPPNWIPGLPLDAEGDIAYRYGDAK